MNIFFFHRLSTRFPNRSLGEAGATVTSITDAATHAHRRHASRRRYLSPPTRVDATRTPTLPHLPQTSHANTLSLRKSASTQLHAPSYVSLRASSSRGSSTVGTVPRNVGQPVDQKRGIISTLLEISRSNAADARQESSSDASTGSPGCQA